MGHSENTLKTLQGNKANSMAQEIHVLNVRLPRDVIDWIDSLVKKGIFNSRSEAIRSFVRDYLTENYRQQTDSRLQEVNM